MPDERKLNERGKVALVGQIPRTPSGELEDSRDSNGAWTGGKFVVSRVREAYDARDRGPSEISVHAPHPPIVPPG